MTYPRHFLGVFGGILAGSDTATPLDIWQCSIRLAKTSSDFASDPDPATVMVNEFKTAVETWMQTPGGGWSNRTRLTYLKMNEIGPDGRYTNKLVTNVYDYATPYITGPDGPASGDPAGALCVSWLTEYKRGPGHRGRLYIPWPGVGPDSSGRIGSAQVTTVAQAAKTFISNVLVGGVSTNQWGACVVSNIGTPGPANEIQKVAVGDVLDHQLRRRNAMVETYTTVTI